MKKKVLFVCIHNSARSQMGEEFLRKFGDDKFETESCGFEPTPHVNPLVVEAMKAEGIDLSNKKTQYIMDLFRAQKYFGYIIYVCKRSMEMDCPVFPGPGVQKEMFWDLDDPEHFEGTDEEKLQKTRVLRDRIKDKVLEFIEEA